MDPPPPPSTKDAIDCLILGERADLVAVAKPPDVLTHPSKLFREPNDMATRLTAHLGTKVLTVHRLDRKTSGVLLFARTPEAAARVGRSFQEGTVRKRYWAIVRGHAPEETTVDRPLRNEDSGRLQEAVTDLRCLARIELPHAVGPYATARYSLVEARPQTGRRHQLRRHLRGMDHPIVGDTVYGDGRHNAFFRARFGWHRMFLHAGWLEVPGEGDDDPWRITAPLEEAFSAACEAFEWPLGPEARPESTRPRADAGRVDG